MSASTIDRPRRAATVAAVASRGRTLAIELLVVLVAYQAYRFVRTLTEGDRARAIDNGQLLLRFEDRIGLNIEQGVQSIVLGSQALIDLFNRIYVWTFWPVVIGMLIVLYVLNRTQFHHYRNALFLSGAVGLVTFGLFPVAPPRMLAGFVDTVQVFSGSTEMARPGDFTNEFAAMPSFHCGWMVLAGVSAWPLVPWPRWRVLLLMPGAAMTVTVMATANHYLVDAIAGIALALGALALSYRLDKKADTEADEEEDGGVDEEADERRALSAAGPVD